MLCNESSREAGVVNISVTGPGCPVRCSTEDTQGSQLYFGVRDEGETVTEF